MYINTESHILYTKKLPCYIKNSTTKFVMQSSMSKNMIFFFIFYCLCFNLKKFPQRLGNWFQRYKQLKDWTNNKKQKKLLALFGCILKTVFASSDSFCLITSHIPMFEAKLGMQSLDSNCNTLSILAKHARWYKLNTFYLKISKTVN